MEATIGGRAMSSPITVRTSDFDMGGPYLRANGPEVARFNNKDYRHINGI
jgi:hypothetical protein